VHVCPRRPYDFNAEERTNCLHAYGVDFYTEKELKDLFSPFGKHSIEWLDDSSMNVVFEEDDVFVKVMHDMVLNWSEDANPSTWFRVAPRHLKKKKSQIEFRRCTMNDKKDIYHDGSKSVFYEYQRRQKTMNINKREKKRARLQRHQSKDRASCGGTASTASVKELAESSSDDEDEKPVTTSFSKGGFFDPLLFMKAKTNEARPPCLASVLAQAEKNSYVGLDMTPTTCPSSVSDQSGERSRSKDRKRPRPKRKASVSCEKGKGKEKGREKGKGKGKGVLVRILPSTHALFQEKNIIHNRHHVSRSFRSLVFSQQKKKECDVAPTRGQAEASASNATVTRIDPASTDIAMTEGGIPPVSDMETRTEPVWCRIESTSTDVTMTEGGILPESNRGEERRVPATSTCRIETGDVAMTDTSGKIETDVPMTDSAPISGVGTDSAVESIRTASEPALSKEESIRTASEPTISRDESIRTASEPTASKEESIRIASASEPTISRDESIRINPEPSAPDHPVRIADSDPMMTKPPDLSPPTPAVPSYWDEYLRINQLTDYQLVHCILYTYQSDKQEHAVTLIPHTMRTDDAVLAKALNATDLKMCKLKEVEKFSRCPLFVCAPFGLKCSLLIDSRLANVDKELLFDLGSSAVSLRYSELQRACNPLCVEGLATLLPR